MPNSNLLSLALPSNAGDKKHVGNLKGSALSIAIAQLAEQHQGHLLLVVPDPQLALKLSAEVEQFSQRDVHLFPDWETLPYDNFHHIRTSFLTESRTFIKCQVKAMASLSSP